MQKGIEGFSIYVEHRGTMRRVAVAYIDKPLLDHIGGEAAWREKIMEDIAPGVAKFITDWATKGLDIKVGPAI